MCNYERYLDELIERKGEEKYGCQCKDKLTKDEFHSKLNDCLKEFPEDWNNKFPSNKFIFTHETVIRRFVEFVKESI